MGTVGKKSGRLVSLDLLRGMTVIGMIVVNSVAGADQTYPLLLHSVWAGYTAADAVFPAFIIMVGVSIAIALSPAKARGDTKGPLLAQISRRSLRLIAFGLLISNLYRIADLEHGGQGHVRPGRLAGPGRRLRPAGLGAGRLPLSPRLDHQDLKPATQRLPSGIRTLTAKFQGAGAASL